MKKCLILIAMTMVLCAVCLASCDSGVKKNYVPLAEYLSEMDNLDYTFTGYTETGEELLYCTMVESDGKKLFYIEGDEDNNFFNYYDGEYFYDTDQGYKFKVKTDEPQFHRTYCDFSNVASSCFTKIKTSDNSITATLSDEGEMTILGDTTEEKVTLTITKTGEGNSAKYLLKVFGDDLLAMDAEYTQMDLIEPTDLDEFSDRTPSFDSVLFDELEGYINATYSQPEISVKDTFDGNTVYTYAKNADFTEENDKGVSNLIIGGVAYKNTNSGKYSEYTNDVISPKYYKLNSNYIESISNFATIYMVIIKNEFACETASFNNLAGSNIKELKIFYSIRDGKILLTESHFTAFDNELVEHSMVRFNKFDVKETPTAPSLREYPMTAESVNEITSFRTLHFDKEVLDMVFCQARNSVFALFDNALLELDVSTKKVIERYSAFLHNAQIKLDGDRLFVSDTLGSQIKIFDVAGDFTSPLKTVEFNGFTSFEAGGGYIFTIASSCYAYNIETEESTMICAYDNDGYVFNVTENEFAVLGKTDSMNERQLVAFGTADGSVKQIASVLYGKLRFYENGCYYTDYNCISSDGTVSTYIPETFGTLKSGGAPLDCNQIYVGEQFIVCEEGVYSREKSVWINAWDCMSDKCAAAEIGDDLWFIRNYNDDYVIVSALGFDGDYDYEVYYGDKPINITNANKMIIDGELGNYMAFDSGCVYSVETSLYLCKYSAPGTLLKRAELSDYGVQVFVYGGMLAVLEENKIEFYSLDDLSRITGSAIELDYPCFDFAGGNAEFYGDYFYYVGIDGSENYIIRYGFSNKTFEKVTAISKAEFNLANYSFAFEQTVFYAYAEGYGLDKIYRFDYALTLLDQNDTECGVSSFGKMGVIGDYLICGSKAFAKTDLAAGGTPLENYSFGAFNGLIVYETTIKAIDGNVKYQFDSDGYYIKKVIFDANTDKMYLLMRSSAVIFEIQV